LYLDAFAFWGAKKDTEKIPDSTIEHVNNDDMNFLDIKNPQKKMYFHYFSLEENTYIKMIYIIKMLTLLRKIQMEVKKLNLELWI
jgi:hypothetical protein